MRGAPPSLTLESCFADSRQDYIVKLIEDAEAAQLRYQSPKQARPDRNEQRYHPTCQSHLYAGSQFRPDRNDQPYHKPDCQSDHYAGSYSAPKHLFFAGRHFNLSKSWETLPHPRSTVTDRQSFLPFLKRPALLKSKGQKFKLRHYPPSCRVDELGCRVILCADATQKYVVGRGDGDRDGDRDRRRE